MEHGLSSYFIYFIYFNYLVLIHGTTFEHWKLAFYFFLTIDKN
jgi:hypothetical protein